MFRSSIPLVDMIHQNPKSTTVGIAEVLPRQLAPSVGISSTGPMESLILISTNGVSSTLSEQIFFGSLEFVPHTLAQCTVFSTLHEGIDLTFGSLRFHINIIGSVQLRTPITSGMDTLVTPAPAPASPPSSGGPRRISSPRAEDFVDTCLIDISSTPCL